MGIVTEYPFGFIILCILLGAGYSYFLYFRDIRQGVKTFVMLSMILFRFLSVTVISFLLLSPLIKRTEKIIEKPIIIVGVDNSSSIASAADSAFYRTEFPVKLNKLVTELSEKAEVKIYSFGDNLVNGFKPVFTDKKTDISAFFSEINTRFSNRNVASVVLISDGIYNEGADPYYAARKIQVPVYTVAMGDTTLRKDIIIKSVIANRVAYKNDRFPVEVLVEMNKCTGLKTKLNLIKGTTTLESKDIRATSEQSVQRITFWLEAKQTGISRFNLQIIPIDGESNKENNHSEFLVEILDARQKIALIYNSPHPDVTALQQALSGSTHFDVDLYREDAPIKSPDTYDLIILNQLPSISSVRDLSPVLTARSSFLFILGTQTDINAFNKLQKGLVINGSKNSFYDSESVVSEDFSLFTLNKQDVIIINSFPPLISPFGAYQFSPLANTMVFQRIANVTTRSPMIMFTKAGEKKIGIIAGENLWRWRIANYIQQSNHEVFDLMMDKIAMYLATKEDKSFFRIHVKNRFSEIEPVEMEAEVFNASYERLTEPDVNITVTDAEKNNYPYIFSKGASSYYLKAGLFPAGTYKYNANVKVGKETFMKNGEFFVSAVNTESAALVADHRLLSRIALSHDGEMVGSHDVEKLSGKLLSRQDVKSVSSLQTKISDLVSTPWLFLLILTLLSAEWILRKREGK